MRSSLVCLRIKDLWSTRKSAVAHSADQELLPNNSFKPSPLRGLGPAESHRAGRLNSGVRPLFLICQKAERALPACMWNGSNGNPLLLLQCHCAFCCRCTCVCHPVGRSLLEVRPNNSFKPSPLRGLGRAESHRAGRLNSGVRRSHHRFQRRQYDLLPQMCGISLVG